MKSHFLKIPTAIALALTLGSGCVLTGEETDAINDALTDPNFPGSTPPVNPGPACFNERFVQPEAQITRSVDLLFVIDTSGSIVDERGAIANGIDGFIGALPANVDFRIAVMLAHGSTSANAGKLYTTGGRPRVFDSATHSVATMQSGLRHIMMNAAEDAGSDGGEQGIYSFNRSMDADRLGTIRTQGFYRDTAALAVVFVSDENDICATYPDGVTPVPDPQGSEVQSFARDCGGINYANVYQRARALQGDRPLAMGAIVYNNHLNIPAVGENEYGYGYLEMVGLANGVSIDIGGTHYSTGLQQIGSMVTVRLNLLVDFTLARPAAQINPDSIRTYTDGAVSTHNYTPATNIVHLDNPGTALSTIDINYCLRCVGVGCGGDT